MEETTPPVQTPPDAGTENKETTPPLEQKAEIDSQAILELVESQEKALAAAEKKIVSLKRKLKGEGEDEEADTKTQIVELQEQIQELRGEHDEELVELRKAREKAKELAEALRAKASLQKTGLGTNQDKLRPEEDLTKGYSPEDLTLMERIASKRGMTVKEYLKSRKK